MRLLVYMRDGRTVYYVEGRSTLRKLTGDEPWHEKPGITTARGIWNPNTGEYVWTRNIQIRYLAKASISVVEEGHPTEVETP